MAKQEKLPKVNFNTVKGRSGHSILMTMTVNGGRVRFSPGLPVDIQYWDKKKQQLSPLANLGGAQAATVNKKLRFWADFALSTFVNNRDVTAKELQQRLLNERDGIKSDVPTEARTTLDGFAQYHVAWRKKYNKKKRANNNLQTVANTISEFATYRGKPIKWQEVDLKFATEFTTWLQRPERGIAHNQICNIFDRLRYFMRAASSQPGRLKYHNNDAYELSAFKPKTEEPYRQHFTEEELEKFLACDLSARPSLEQARDLFVLNCYTGLRRSDAKRVNRTHVIEKDGVMDEIKVRVEKTNKDVVIPLFPTAIQILEKYDCKLPHFADAYYNRLLKKAAELAGLTTVVYHVETRNGVSQRLKFRKCDRISSHDARRSFATNFYEMGFPSILIMQLTGHKSEAQFQKYICATPGRAAKQIRKLFNIYVQQRRDEADNAQDANKN